MDSISNGPKVPDVEMAGLRHCTLRLYGDGVSALATGPAESAVRMTLSTPIRHGAVLPLSLGGLEEL